MPTYYGLRVFNASGQLRLEVTDSITRFLGTYTIPYNSTFTVNPSNDNTTGLNTADWDKANGGVVVLTPVENQSNAYVVLGSNYNGSFQEIPHKMSINTYNGVKRELYFQKQPNNMYKNDTVVSLYMYS